VVGIGVVLDVKVEMFLKLGVAITFRILGHILFPELELGHSCLFQFLDPVRQVLLQFLESFIRRWFGG
jgi:hypothetical protein